MITILSLIINVLIIIAGLAFGFSWKHWAPRLLEYAFDKKLIKYKTDLETEKEKQLAEYGKTITGFNKCFDKKYEIYPVLYGSIIKLHGELKNSWDQIPDTHDFQVQTEGEFSDYIDTFIFSSPDRWGLVEKKKNGHIIKQDILRLLPQHFLLSIGETNNYFLEQLIFISRDIESLFEKFRENAKTIHSAYRQITSYPNIGDQWGVIETTCEENRKLVEDILRQMRSELEHNISSQDS